MRTLRQARDSRNRDYMEIAFASGAYKLGCKYAKDVAIESLTNKQKNVMHLIKLLGDKISRFFTKLLYKAGFRWVNVYEVTREYGGPEEGGWWYNQYSCIESKLVTAIGASAVQDYLWNKHSPGAYGDIYSVLGGTLIRVLIEGRVAESEHERPHYE